MRAGQSAVYGDSVDADGERGPKDEEEKHEDKISVVSQADAVADEVAVAVDVHLLVEVAHAVVAVCTVRCQRWSLDHAGAAVSRSMDRRFCLALVFRI